MNFILGAFLLILLLFPGFVFRLSYLSQRHYSTRSFNLKASSFPEELLFSILPAFLLHAGGYLVVEGCFSNVSEERFIHLLTNTYNDKTIIGMRSFGLFSAYIVLANIIAYLGGRLLHKWSVENNWHLRFPFLRIYNEWQIYFEGILLDRDDVPGTRADVNEVWLDILIEAKDTAYIYTGCLEDYVIDADEKLDRIYLSAVRRRKLGDDSRPSGISEGEIDDRYYPMPGNYFVVSAREIRNINISYYSWEVE